MATAQASDAVGRVNGFGKIVKIIYVILALAATGRSLYQVIAKFDEAPLAYTLSAVAAVVYILITVALFNKGETWRKVATAGAILELIGVLTVGALSLFAPDLFAHPSVWSWFGSGYIFLPLIMPILGLIYLNNLRKVQQSA